MVAPIFDWFNREWNYKKRLLEETNGIIQGASANSTSRIDYTRSLPMYIG